MPGNEISNASENKSFAAFPMHLRLSRGTKEDFLEVGESKAGLQDG